ncbi:MAG: hypothetical protein LUD72_06240 [Bacteroidales bacterium]|nr:hypothetical protein [Bacteroidales bacterium]
MAANVEIYADDALRRLDWLMSTNAVARRQLQRLVREALKNARKEVGRAAKSALKTDPRGASRGVRTVTYKKEIGGNVNILTARRGSVRTREWSKKAMPAVPSTRSCFRVKGSNL